MWPYSITDAVNGLLRLDGRMSWRVADPEGGKTVYLTFDDGPVPGATPWVLDTLASLGVKATFFCIGKNIVAHPELFARVKDEGHGIGNHTWDHPSGWKTGARTYYRSVLACQRLTGTALFRPPYGRISNRQLAALRKRFTIVMWDVLAHDFDDRYTDDDRVSEMLRRIRTGSILVFHDSMKCNERMRRAMPAVVKALLAEGYRFDVLPGPTREPTSRR